MVKRRGLADLLRSETQRLEQGHEETESVTHQSVEQSLSDTDQQISVETESVTAGLPKYKRLIRKEARLHEAQYDELTRLARELNRKKREVGEIITANTLLRVATELLLQRRAELRGDTEEELLRGLMDRQNTL